MTSLCETVACSLLTLFLLPCAIQDWRTRRVSNWLTIPGFALAWIAALWFQNLPVTIAVFVGCYVAWQMKWMGAADGKLATLMAAVAPEAIWASGLLLGLSFLLLRLRGRQDEHLPAAAWYFAGSQFHLLYLLASPLFTT